MQQILSVLANRYSSEAPVSQNPVWVHSMRWSVAHTDENKDKLCKMLHQYAKHWIFQAEDTKNNPHYQGYVNLKDKDRSSTLGKKLNADFLGIQFLPASDEGKEKLKKYCMKDDTRVAGPWSDTPIYLGEDLPQELVGWQKTLFDMLQQKPDRRSVLWIHESTGRTGKSEFAKYMCFKHEAVFMSYGNSKDLLNIVFKFKNKKCYIFDLPRTKPIDLSGSDLYSTIESIKDGMFINTKYETGIVMMSSPHVVVFSNYMPDMKKLSLDRWKIYTIENGELVKK